MLPLQRVDAADALVSTMDGHKVGPYMFRVTRQKRTSSGGTVDSERITVKVIYGVSMKDSFVSFGVDVSGDLEVDSPVTPLEVTASYKVHTEFSAAPLSGLHVSGGQPNCR